MGLLQNAAQKIFSAGIGSVLDGAGEFAKAVRQAITGELSQEQRAKLEEQAQELEGRVLDAKNNLVDAQKEIIVAEAKGESWLQRNWRPLLMLWFAGLVGAHWLGYTAPNLSEQTILSLLGIVKIGVGGYIIGRSGEKLIPKAVEIFRDAKKK
jgi:hypothetical protein